MTTTILLCPRSAINFYTLTCTAHSNYGSTRKCGFYFFTYQYILDIANVSQISCVYRAIYFRDTLQTLSGLYGYLRQYTQFFTLSVSIRLCDV